MAAPRRLFCNIIVLRTIVAGQDTSALCFVCTFFVQLQQVCIKFLHFNKAAFCYQ